jgi:hypothetical protein
MIEHTLDAANAFLHIRPKSSLEKADFEELAKKVECKAARKKMTAALSELARLHSQLPMSRAAFGTQIQRIADEHAEPYGCKLLLQHNSDGVVELRIKDQKAEFQCEICKTTECFFHPRTE